MEAFVELVMQKPAAHEEVALGIDILQRRELPQLEQVLENWKAQQVPYEILFLDSSDATLVKRYKETRRSHPLAGKGVWTAASSWSGKSLRLSNSRRI